MTPGPPPSAAGPSQTAASISHEDAPLSQLQPPQAAALFSNAPYTSQFAVQPQPATRSYYGGPHHPTFSVAPQGSPIAQSGQSYPSQSAYYAQSTAPGASQTPAGSYPYYNYPSNPWTNAWNTGTYQYPSGSSYPYPYSTPQQNVAPQPPAGPTQPQQKIKTPTPSLSPSPPPPEYHKDWDATIKSFLSTIGFSQALRGFEADMVVLNPEWERKEIPNALAELMKGLLNLGQPRLDKDAQTVQERPLDERKLDYVHLANCATPRSQTSIIKDISRFLAQNRARNDASNRNEFLLSLAEKRRRLNENGDSAKSPVSSCARTDAKTQNRDLQMKYDIAKNEDGPLRRTTKTVSSTQPDIGATGKLNDEVSSTPVETYPSAERYPALDERLQNVEKHLAVRYVPSPPRSLLDRLKFLEDHLVHLEREYPPWAALHFNQPSRGWPPPPRATPIIVPSHLTSATTSTPSAVEGLSSTSGSPTESTEGLSHKGKGKQGRQTKSSLHRAVMEKLEVQKAINDLAGSQVSTG
ncbi:hypothetical protein C8Q74DRAFT_1350222 [Fomes fomentarius]|nr:hypothetical protein C8Q74DRAFT_1350222 [Fomes fomentarius]